MSVAILIVNGGQNPPQGKWIELCINQIKELTTYDRYKIYVWNNDYEDQYVVNFLDKSDAKVYHYNPSKETFKNFHFHRTALQKLYNSLDKKLYSHVVVMDSDAFPIKKNWLKYLLDKLNEETVLTGVWRDELKDAITPYIHPSCLCLKTEFIRKNNLTFDFLMENTEDKINDTMSHFTDLTLSLGKSVFKLHRSNKNDFHRLIGGVYGDLIYHHGAGSRSVIGFWDEEKKINFQKKNKVLVDKSAEILFTEKENYLNWLVKDTNELVEKSSSLQELIELSKKDLSYFPPSISEVIDEKMSKLLLPFIKKVLKKLMRI